MFIKCVQTLIIGNIAQPMPSLSHAPADVSGTGANTECCRAESYQGYPFTVLFCNKAHNLTYPPGAKPVTPVQLRGIFQNFASALQVYWSDSL